MRAAVLESFGTTVTVSEVPTPKPGPGEVLIRIRASGLCATDLKVMLGNVPTTPLPHIIGHEPAGEIASLGDGVAGIKVGDHVIAGVDVSCGHCHYCRTSRLNYCANIKRLGMEVNGSVAEYLLVPAANCVVVPEHVSFTNAAPIADAVASPFRAVNTVANVRVGQKIAVYGVGGLGLSAIQIASVIGADVIAISRNPARRKLALELGAVDAIDPDEAPVDEQLRDLTQGLGVHAYIDVVGIESSLQQGVRAVRKGGIVVILGYSVPSLNTPMPPMILSEVRIGGSRGSTREELMASVDLVASGKVKTIVGRTLALDDVNDGLEGLREGAIIGRSIVEFH